MPISQSFGGVGVKMVVLVVSSEWVHWKQVLRVWGSPHYADVVGRPGEEATEAFVVKARKLKEPLHELGVPTHVVVHLYPQWAL